jgi:hypothetical protein
VVPAMDGISSTCRTDAALRARVSSREMQLNLGLTKPIFGDET